MLQEKTVVQNAPLEMSVLVKPKLSREPKKKLIVSHVCSDGTLVEMVYAKNGMAAQLAVSAGGKVNLFDSVYINKEGVLCDSEDEAVYIGLPDWRLREHVDRNFICLASDVGGEFGVQDVYREVREHIQKYVMLEDTRFYDVAAGYVLMSWVFDAFTTVPYLRVIGDFGTGKSRFLEVIGKLCNRAILASGSITMPAVFRTLDMVQGTLVFDEADFKSSDMSDDIVKLLNGGHKKDAPVVRMEIVKEKLKTTSFRVFGPKILGSRRSFADTALESRCITQRLFPVQLSGVPVHLSTSFEQESQELRNKLLSFRLRKLSVLKDDESALGAIQFPRLRQTALALTSVMRLVGEEELGRVVEYLLQYEKTLLSTVATDPHADVLLCIAMLMETNDIVRKSGQLHMGLLSHEFSMMFYDDYAERETRQVDTRDGVLYIPGGRVSARKIGVIVEKLGIAKERDKNGIYIPLRTEAKRIHALVERSGLLPTLIAARAKEDSAKAPHSNVSKNELVDDEPFTSRGITH